MADSRPTIFADGVTEAQVAHGVARITLATTGTDGKAVPCATLCVPVTQLPRAGERQGNLLKQIEDRERASAGAQPDAEAPAHPPSGGAFRFQN